MNTLVFGIGGYMSVRSGTESLQNYLIGVGLLALLDTITVLLVLTIA